MAILFMDSFDHYGGNTSSMLLGVWAEASTVGSSGLYPNARTGTYSYRMSSGGVIRRAFKDGALSTVGIGSALFFDGLPQASNSFAISLTDINNSRVLTITSTTSGNIRIYRGSVTGALLFESSAPVIVASSWQHLEFKAVIDDVAGAIEVRWNELTVASITGVDTKAGSLLPAQVLWEFVPATDSAVRYVDDVFAWDTSGSNNNDFIGDKRVHTQFVDSDTSVADYTVVGASSGFDAINEADPDFDTSYISIAAAGDEAEFGMQNLPSDVSSIAAVQVCSLMRKTNAGTAGVKNGLVSGPSTVEGTEHPITTAYTYWMDVFETDPATGALWTPAGFNAAKLRINRAS